MLSSLDGPGFGVGAASPACEVGNLHGRTHPDLTIAGGATPAVTVPTDVYASGAVREAP